jgi:pimeloyl-ACP methyl ester carboxylesterase
MHPLVKLLIAACTLPAASLILPPSVQAARPSAQADSITPSRVPPHVTGVPGTLLTHEPIDTPIVGALAWKVRYVSADVNGVAHEVGGLVIAPEGPGKSRKVLTWCHGTTGLGDAACPSAQPSPARELITYFDAAATRQIDYGVPGLQGFIDDGYVVCATDYQGLGTPGQHQYMVNRTQALDAVFLVHAARGLDVGAGTRFGCAGWSQGGGAAAAVAELDAADYGEFTLVGTVPMSPAAGEIAFTSGDGPAAAMSDASIAPDSHIVMLLAGTQIANHGELHLSDLFTPLGEEIITTTWNTQPVHHLNDTLARLFRLKGPVLQRTPTNVDAWKAAITAGSAATRKPVAPVLLCIDGFGDGTVVPVTWQKAYAEKVEELGGSVQIRDYPHDDHFSLPASCVGDARRWLNDAF